MANWLTDKLSKAFPTLANYEKNRASQRIEKEMLNFLRPFMSQHEHEQLSNKKSPLATDTESFQGKLKEQVLKIAPNLAACAKLAIFYDKISHQLESSPVPNSPISKAFASLKTPISQQLSQHAQDHSHSFSSCLEAISTLEKEAATHNTSLNIYIKQNSSIIDKPFKQLQETLRLNIKANPQMFLDEFLSLYASEQQREYGITEVNVSSSTALNIGSSLNSITKEKKWSIEPEWISKKMDTFKNFQNPHGIQKDVLNHLNLFVTSCDKEWQKIKDIEKIDITKKTLSVFGEEPAGSTDTEQDQKQRQDQNQDFEP